MTRKEDTLRTVWSDVDLRAKTPSVSAAQLCAVPLRRFPTRPRPLLYQGPFEFREDAYHLPHGAACVRFSVNCFRQGLELDPLTLSDRRAGYPFLLGLPLEERETALCQFKRDFRGGFTFH